MFWISVRIASLITNIQNICSLEVFCIFIISLKFAKLFVEIKTLLLKTGILIPAEKQKKER